MLQCWGMRVLECGGAGRVAGGPDERIKDMRGKRLVAWALSAIMVVAPLSACAQQPAGGGAAETPEATVFPTPEATANVTPTADPNATPTPENLEYQAPESVGGTPTPTPKPTPTPSPSPAPTFDPGSLTVEDDEP